MPEVKQKSSNSGGRSTYQTKVVKLAGRDEFLDFSDAVNFYLADSELKTGTVALSYTAYGAKPKYTCKHYLSTGEALLLCDDLLGFRFRLNKDPKLKNTYALLLEAWRGGDGRGYGHPELTKCSSIIKISVEDSTRYPNDKMVFFEIIQCEGVATTKGIITPKEGAQKHVARFSCKLSDIRPKLTILKAYIEAKLATSETMYSIHEADKQFRLTKTNYSNSSNSSSSYEESLAASMPPPEDGEDHY